MTSDKPIPYDSRTDATTTILESFNNSQNNHYLKLIGGSIAYEIFGDREFKPTANFKGIEYMHETKTLREMASILKLTSISAGRKDRRKVLENIEKNEGVLELPLFGEGLLRIESNSEGYRIEKYQEGAFHS